jgi:hypothetical protein
MPDYLDDNPPELDTPDETRGAIRDAGGNPMDVGEQKEAVFAWSLMHGSKPRDSPTLNAAETEMVATSLTEEHGVDIDDWPDIPGAPPWYGPE